MDYNDENSKLSVYIRFKENIQVKKTSTAGTTEV